MNIYVIYSDDPYTGTDAPSEAFSSRKNAERRQRELQSECDGKIGLQDMTYEIAELELQP